MSAVFAVAGIILALTGAMIISLAVWPIYEFLAKLLASGS